MDFHKLLELAQASGNLSILVAAYLLIKACERLARIEKALEKYMEKHDGIFETSQED